ncbi:laccase-15-like [Carex rostrata]
MKNTFLFLVLFFFIFHGLFLGLVQSISRNYTFIVEDVPYTRLCHTKNITTVNGQFPGPTLYAYKGDTIQVTVYNRARNNVTIHWHGVEQPRNPWSDGPEYITQCPIMPGDEFTYTLILSIEEGTLWWHAHNDFLRTTVYGAIVIYPVPGTTYPHPTPDEEHVVILGEWWNEDVIEVLERALDTGGAFQNSDAYTINGQPGDLYNCSSNDTYKIQVEYGKTYLLRMINADMTAGLFLSVANHNLTLVGSDGIYTEPITSDYIVIYPGETMNFLLEANQSPENRYYMAARPFEPLNINLIDNTTTTAIIEYINSFENQSSTSPIFPLLPDYNDTNASTNFTFSIRGLLDGDHPIKVPTEIDRRILMTLSLNVLSCEQQVCNGTRLATSANNISFVEPTISILEAYWKRISGVYGTQFPDKPPVFFDFTAENQTESPFTRRGREVKVLNYNETVEVVYQGTSLFGGEAHPMHIHGYSFFVVGWGLGNFNATTDPLTYNLMNPPLKNTIGVPRNGWVAIRFSAHNPGVWFLHCHLERHMIWGMKTVFLVKNGPSPSTSLLPPPPYMPPCVAPSRG